MKAMSGFLPSAANRIVMVRSVIAIAISGEAMVIAVERSVRRSSASGMSDLAAFAAAAHQQAELLAAGARRIERRRQPAVKHHRDAVGDFGKLVEVLADHQDRGAARGEIDQGLADGR